MELAKSGQSWAWKYFYRSKELFSDKNKSHYKAICICCVSAQGVKLTQDKTEEMAKGTRVTRSTEDKKGTYHDQRSIAKYIAQQTKRKSDFPVR